METAVHYDLQQKQLCFRLRESITTDPDIELRFQGYLNTVTGVFDYKGTLCKFVGSGPVVKGEATQPLRIGAGVGISKASRDEPFVTVRAKKSLALLEGDDTVLSAKAHIDYQPQSSSLTRHASVRVSRRCLNFTERQDLLLAGGVEVDWPHRGRTTGSSKPKPGVFLQVRENNWGLHYRSGRWQVTYDL